MGLEYQYTTDEGPNPTTYNGTWLSLAEINATSNTGNMYQNIKARVTGDEGDYWSENTVDDYVLSVSTPSITGVSSGDGQVTITVSASDESHYVYIRYRINQGGNTWQSRSGVFRRLGSGDVVVDGLTNGIDYMFCAEEYSGATYSDFSEPRTAYPDSDPNSEYRNARKIYQRDYIARTALQVAQQQGERFVFKNDGSGASNGITVYGLIVDDMRRNVGIRRGEIDVQSITVSIPRQTSFPPDNFNINSVVEVDGEEYQVQDYSTSPSNKTYAAVWLLECASSRDLEAY